MTMTKNAWNIEVIDRQSFQEFARLLHKDFKTNPEKWENNKLESFLEATEAYASDLDGYYLNNHPDINAEIPTWRVFADILRGAVIYE